MKPFPTSGRYLPARRPRGLQALPEAACLPGKDHRGTDSGLRRAVPGNGGGGNSQIRQLRQQRGVQQGTYPLRPVRGGEGRPHRGRRAAVRGLQGRDRLPRRRYPSRRRALRHGAHRGSRADDTEADGARHARPRPGPGGTGRHPPLRPSLAGTGMRGGPPSPAGGMDRTRCSAGKGPRRCAGSCGQRRWIT